MKSANLLRVASKMFIALSAVSIFSVSLMALFSPQSVMDLVSVRLTNTDAYSSIRGVYGGVGITLFIVLLYSMRKSLIEALGLLSILWGLYAFCRVITIISEGPLGSFGKQWLGIESTFFVIAFALYQMNRRAMVTNWNRAAHTKRQQTQKPGAALK